MVLLKAIISIYGIRYNAYPGTHTSKYTYDRGYTCTCRESFLLAFTVINCYFVDFFFYRSIEMEDVVYYSSLLYLQ